ncbi:MAG: EAL domain-containing protein [Bacillota bacterium]|nr:EAL domain-containing protein [Bacillota bacterium]
MNGFALAMFFSFMVYLSVAIHVILLDRKSALNRTFFALNTSFAIWSLALAFFISAPDKESVKLWDYVASVGYNSFASFVLHFFLLYTGKTRFLKKWWSYIIIYLPAVAFIANKLAVNADVNDYVMGSHGWQTDINTGSIWFQAGLIHYILYCIISFILCYVKWRKAESIRIRKQAKIIFISGILSFIVGSFSYFAFFIFNHDYPDMTVVGLLIWSVGIIYGIQKYKLLILTPAVAAENILQTIIDSVILINPQGRILHSNAETGRLLGYEEAELADTELDRLFPGGSSHTSSHIISLLKKGPVRNLESDFITKDNQQIPIMLSASVCRDQDDATIGYVIVSKDVTKLRDMENRLKHLAHHDALTNLPNRLLLNDRLSQAIARAKRDHTYFALVMLDLDQFKKVNDVLGHSIGDLLLIEMAKRLTKSVRQSDTAVRLGGDEFVLLIEDLKSPEDYETVTKKILDRITEPCDIEQHKLNMTASMGISIYPTDGSDMENLMKNADIAMYFAKNHGRNRYQLFSTSMSLSAITADQLEDELDKALENNQLMLLYQPVIDLSTGDIIGTEALIRWNHPQYGMIEPAKFIKAAEESGSIIPIGEWVLSTACRQAKKWRDAGYPPAHVSVNLSLRQFQQMNLVEVVLAVLRETGLSPESILLEITESTVLHDMEYTIDVIQRLAQHHVLFVIDDFGAGYSSLLYFRKLPIYAIKLDRFFTSNIADDPECAAIVSAIIAMAHNMKFKVIAEGIEDDRQLASLRSLDQHFFGSPVCDGAQGYLFSKPVSEDMIEKLLEKQKMGRIGQISS